MSWLTELFTNSESPAASLLTIALVIASGLMLGRVRLAGVRLGTAGVLFSGMGFGHFGFAIEPSLREFLAEFGLILFVFSIGLTIGPGFFNALRAHGLSLNLLAASVVLLGMLMTVAINRVAGIEMPIAVGIFSGATTNTPSLASATQTLQDNPPNAAATRRAFAQAGGSARFVEDEATAGSPGGNGDVAKLPGLGYAVAYPFGVVGIILAMLILRRLLDVDPVDEARLLREKMRTERPRLERINLRVTNRNLEGLSLHQVPDVDGEGAHGVVSRLLHDGQLCVPQPNTILHLGDVILAVGTAEQLEQLRIVVGEPADIDLVEFPSEITFRWAVVTHSEMVGQTLGDLHLADRFGVQITRVRRAEVEMPPVGQLRLGLGDHLRVVGHADAVAAVCRLLGNLPKELEKFDLTPIFVGIALGVIVASIPFPLPGESAAVVKLGLAAGPLLIAILLSSLGRFGPWVFYLPQPASHILREVGIAIFLATVGLRAGDRFIASLTQGDGAWWMLAGIAITLVPLLIVGLIGGWVLKIAYPTLVGVIAGSMTDPPALAFANVQTDSELPAISYATVIPLTMILRVVAAQLLVLTGA